VRITTGKVVSGKVVIDDEPLPEGSTVTIVTTEESEEFELGVADEVALLESIQQANNSLIVPADEVISKLKSQR
jgi:hypothetical protein